MKIDKWVRNQDYIDWFVSDEPFDEDGTYHAFSDNLKSMYKFAKLGNHENISIIKELSHIDIRLSDLDIEEKKHDKG